MKKENEVYVRNEKSHVVSENSGGDRTFINMTPHAIKIIREGKVILNLESEGVVRLGESRKLLKVINGVPIYQKTYSTATLPEEKEGVYYVVALPIAQAYPHRYDLLVPDDYVRDEAGRVIGCRGLARVIR